MERYFLMDNVAEVVQCRFFFCCFEIFFIWLIEAMIICVSCVVTPPVKRNLLFVAQWDSQNDEIAWLHYLLLLFACLWQLHSVDTFFFHIPFLLGTFSAESVFFCFVFVCLFVFGFFLFVFFFVCFVLFFENLLDFFACFKAHPLESCFGVTGLPGSSRCGITLKSASSLSAYPILALPWSVSCWSS